MRKSLHSFSQVWVLLQYLFAFVHSLISLDSFKNIPSRVYSSYISGKLVHRTVSDLNWEQSLYILFQCDGVEGERIRLLLSCETFPQMSGTLSCSFIYKN